MSKLCGAAITVQRDSHICGQLKFTAEHKAQSARTVSTTRFACLHNCLATIAPDVARYWNHSKNVKSPQQVLAGTSFRAEWKCPACNHEWQAPIANRVRVRSGCPKCSVARRVRNSQLTFAQAQPAELAEWDHERNEAEGFYPHLVTLGSNKQVHWICSCCPRGQPHRWTALPAGRVLQGKRCAVCDGKQACVCNSLESLCPSVAGEFDVDKNGFGPSEITARSNKEVWWRNAKHGSWRQAVDRRTTGWIRSNTKQVHLRCIPRDNQKLWLPIAMSKSSTCIQLDLKIPLVEP